MSVTQRVLGGDELGSVISFENGTSSFVYNFNAGYFPPNGKGGPDGLVVRVQNVGAPGAHSGLAVVRRLGGPLSRTFEHVDESKLLVRCPGINTTEPSPPPTASSPCADDPRIAYRSSDGLYYMTWQNNSGLVPGTHRVTHLATSPTPWLVNSWSWHGPMSPGQQTTSGASILLRDDVPGSPHYAFITTDDDAGALLVATAPHDDPLTWTTQSKPWASGRPGAFDHYGLASGPSLSSHYRLSDGNYLYLYSIDNRQNCQSASCGTCGLNCSAPAVCPFCRDGRCALGWAVLSGNDPTTVIARANATLLRAELAFETVGTPGFATQTPWVIFTCGLQALGGDEFVVWYGAGDTNIGAARIKVDVPSESSTVKLVQQ